MTSSADRIWEIIENVGVCMFVTRTPAGEIRARPLQARASREEDCIYFVTDAGSGKAPEIEHEPRVGLIFIHSETNAYLAISALAAIFHDSAKAKALWKMTDDLWWDGPDDPDVCVVRAELLSAEIWDGPAMKAVELFEFLKATVSGQEPNLGENRKSTVYFEK